MRTKAPLAFDLSASFEATGRFVLVDDYDIAGGGIVTEMIHDDQEFLREEARRRDFAWVKGEVGIEDRAQQYGHRAAIVLITGGRHTGKSFLAKKARSDAGRRRTPCLSAGRGESAQGIWMPISPTANGPDHGDGPSLWGGRAAAR